ncbi:hypothetical protein QGM71_13050 [Virgibacillus sp. C22-A2]|uniref:DUF4181 domain-containing protein n=1 Tax=Virgibacillus tibetensis TaxID=3042313 RepID=A0ABU6KH72_9BACI|nr:hypothetical protein [Virgibacillus sp. C22-A2]
MRHPYEKFIRIELLSLASAILIGIIALAQGYTLLIFLCLYLLALSLACNALIELHRHEADQAGKQILRAIMLFILASFMLFQL